MEKYTSDVHNFQNIYFFIVALFSFLKATIFSNLLKNSIDQGRTSPKTFGILINLFILTS